MNLSVVDVLTAGVTDKFIKSVMFNGETDQIIGGHWFALYVSPALHFQLKKRESDLMFVTKFEPAIACLFSIFIYKRLTSCLKYTAKNCFVVTYFYMYVQVTKRNKRKLEEFENEIKRKNFLTKCRVIQEGKKELLFQNKKII